MENCKLWILVLVCGCFGLSSQAQAEQAYCTHYGINANLPIHKVCKEGDIVGVTAAQVIHYCDFSKQIIDSPIEEDMKVCQYIGHARKFRSRVDGSLKPFMIHEK